MIENKTKRTIIVTVDNATVADCNKNTQQFLNLQNYLIKMGVGRECMVKKNDGLYFKRAVEM